MNTIAIFFVECHITGHSENTMNVNLTAGFTECTSQEAKS